MAPGFLTLLLLIPSTFTIASDSVVPVIDLAAWTRPETHTAQERQAAAQAVGEACRIIGFFAIRNHGVNASVIHEAWTAARDFFDLPLETKLASKTQNEEEYPYGYENSESLALGKTSGDPLETPPDLKETFSIGPYNPAAGMPSRRFPSEPRAFQKALTEYYESMEDLAKTLLRIFAVALNLPEMWFEDKMDKHLAALRILNYAPIQDSSQVSPGQLRASAHTDYGTLTILKSGGPGLQVKKDVDTDDWVDVPYLADAFVINLGDLMQRWTNDKWVSTLHRVIIPQGESERRQSIAYFSTVNGDCQVDPKVLDRDNSPKYPPIRARDHLMAKHLASMGVQPDPDDASAAPTSSSSKDEL